MKKKMVQCAFTGAVTGIVIYLVRKKMAGDNRKKTSLKKEEEFASKQRKRFSEAYGEYTL